jgi:hypothetical protein
MTWFIEQIHRDGFVLFRQAVLDGELRIGRALDNDFVIDDPHCAPYHALLTVEAEGNSALLKDLNTRNGIAPQHGKRALVYTIQNDQPYRIGQTNIRVRSSAWPLSPEQHLSLRAVWPFAMVALILVLIHVAWGIWLRDVNEKSPPYLPEIVGAAVGLSLWSGMYALLGRLISGAERFFTHLLIACAGYIVINLVDDALELLAFSMNWLWPARISTYVVILLVALLVRAHLRVADPRHWPVLRWVVALAAGLAVTVPIGQLWISSQRLTNIQALGKIEHPAFRLAQPVNLDTLSQSALELKTRVDSARGEAENAEFNVGYDD